MVDIGTGLSILGSKDLLLKVLGPSADYLGEKTLGLTKKADINLNNIFKKAEQKLLPQKQKIGQVPHRVLGQVILNGSICDDEIEAEYFGGVLASSKSEISRDDRGATISALIGRLSAYDLRAHYLFYYSMKELYEGRNVSTRDETGSHYGLNGLLTFFNIPSFHLSMGFSDAEMKNRNTIMATTLIKLANEGLLSSNIRSGPVSITSLDKFNPEINSEGYWVFPSLLGLDLFMWAHGYGGEDTDNFFKKDFGITLLESIKNKPHAIAVTKTQSEVFHFPRKMVYEVNDGNKKEKYYFDYEGMHEIPDDETESFLKQSNDIVRIEKTLLASISSIGIPMESVLNAKLIEVEGAVHLVLNNKSYYVNSWGYPNRWGKGAKDLIKVSVEEFNKYEFGF